MILIIEIMMGVKNAIKKNKKILTTGIELPVSQDTTWYPIYGAIMTNDTYMVSLVADKSNVNLLIGPDVESPLFIALLYDCNSDIIKILIEKGADIHWHFKGYNIFHYFGFNRNKEVWETIKEYVTPEMLNEVAEDKLTPLTFLILFQLEEDDLNNPDVIYLLNEFIKNGGNPNYIVKSEEDFNKIIDYLNEENFLEYKNILLEGMMNNPPIDDSEKLILQLDESSIENLCK